jgi:protein-disulfide isomerase
MSSNRATGRQPKGGPAIGRQPGGEQQKGDTTPRRSARQQRRAAREANRSLTRAGTRGSGGRPGGIVLYSIVALVVAVALIGAAYLLNQPRGAASGLASPIPPQASQITPTSLPMNGRTVGDLNAKVTIDLWEDFQCTYCYVFTRSTEPQIVSNFVATGKAKMTFHDEITIDLPGQTESLDAANAALCANDQGKFWPYHDWLYANQYQERSGAFSKKRLKSIASAMGGLDLSEFDSCVDGGTHNGEVQTEQKNLPTSSPATPTIVVNGTVLSGYDYSTVAGAVSAVLGESPGPSVSSPPSPA